MKNDILKSTEGDYMKETKILVLRRSGGLSTECMRHNNRN